MSTIRYLFDRMRCVWEGSIRRQMAWSFSLASVAIILVSVSLLYYFQRDFFHTQSIDNAFSLARSLSVSSVSWVLSNDEVGLQEVLQGAEKATDLKFAAVLTPQGEVLASTRPEYNGRFFSDAVSQRLLKSKPEPRVLLDESNLIDVAVPIKAGDRLIGWVRIEQTRDTSNANLREIAAVGLGIAILLVLSTVFVATWMSRRLTSGLNRLAKVADDAEHGKAIQHEDSERKDEIGELARHLYKALDAIEAGKRSTFESEARLKAILKTAVDGIHIVDASGTLIEANDAFLHGIGYGETCLGHLKIWDWDAQASPDTIRAGIASQIASGDPVVLETRYRRKDGHEFWVEVCVRGFQISGQELIYASSRDISERKKTEIALKESEERSKFAIEGAGDGVWDWDMQSNAMQFSRLYMTMLGYAENELPHHADTWANSVHPGDMARVQQNLRDYLEGKTETYRIELRLRCKDGSYKWILCRGTVAGRGQNGKPIRMIGIHSDIAEQKAAQARIQRLSQLYATLSHVNETVIHLEEEEGEEHLFHAVCRIAVEQGGMNMAWMGCENPTTHRIAPVASHGDHTDYLQGIVISSSASVPEGRGPTGTAFRENRPVFIDDFANSPAMPPWKARATSYGWGSSAGIPITRGGKPYAVLTLYQSEVNAWDEDAQKLVEEIAKDLSFALDLLEIKVQRKQDEIAVRESEKSLNEAQSIAKLGSYILDIPAGIWKSSAALDRLFGIGDTYERSVAGWQAMIHPDDRTMMDDYLKNEVLGQGKAFDKEYRIIRHYDRAERWVHGIGKLELDAKGNAVLLQGTIQDITENKLAEQALQESEEKYRRLFDLSEDPMWLILDSRLVMANRAATKLLGYETAEALIDTHPSGFSPELQPDGIPSYEKANAMMEIAYREGYHRFEWVHKKKNGEEFFVEVSLTRVPYEGRNALFCIWRDISERKRAEASLIKLSLAAEQSSSSIVITDLDAHIEYVNATFSSVTGYSRDEVIGQNPRILQSGKNPKATYEEMWAHLNRGEVWHGELINRRKNGSEFIESVALSPVRQADGRITNYLAVKQDITEKKQAEARIESLAHFDQLTGLPNRSLLHDLFKIAHGLAQRNAEPLAVMFLDLDHFKNINDTLGHTIGDQLLMEVARRLKASLREEDTVSRLGGDEFILVLSGTDADGAAMVASKLIEVISQPCQIGQHELVITPSIGIATYPYDGEDFEMLLKNADTAMYRAKKASRNDFCFFTPEMQAHSARSLLLSNELRHALKNNELQLDYQPQFAMQGRHIIGVEALLRWTHPRLGRISPAEFIPIAEDSGQIIPIGEWVLRTAASQLKAWMDSGLPPMTVAVNLSAVQFRQANITEVVTGILAEVGLAPEYLELELTEAAAMDDPLAAIEVMDKLHEYGIRMSIDDFGTGYSSLSYMKKFKVYKLKIDQSFVRNLTSDREDKAIINAIISMAKGLGMVTIAEGVETQEQLDLLHAQGCHEVQGYYLSKPLPADQLAEFVKNRD